MSEGKFEEGQYVRVKSGNPKLDRKYWGAICIIASRECYFVRKVFRTDYSVIIVGSLMAATFKESDLEAYRP